MAMEPEPQDFEDPDADYFSAESLPSSKRAFGASLLHERLSVLPNHPPLVCATDESVTTAVRAMQRERRGCVLVTEDGTASSRLLGIFSERDVLFRIVDRGRNPAVLPIREVMTTEVESLPSEASIAWVLNKMALGGFRHIPVVNEREHPVSIVSMRDVVQFLVDFFPRDVLNLPPEYRRERFRTREGA